MNIIDIYSVNKKDNSNNIFKINDIHFKLNNKMNKINSHTNYIYVYGNKYLIISDNDKKCYISENYKNVLINKYMVNYSNIKYLPIDHFPFIDKYNEIKKQIVDVFYNKIFDVEILFVNEITDKYSIRFIRINKELQQTAINSIINSILE